MPNLESRICPEIQCKQCSGLRSDVSLNSLNTEQCSDRIHYWNAIEMQWKQWFAIWVTALTKWLVWTECLTLFTIVKCIALSLVSQLWALPVSNRQTYAMRVTTDWHCSGWAASQSTPIVCIDVFQCYCVSERVCESLLRVPNTNKSVLQYCINALLTKWRFANQMVRL